MGQFMQQQGGKQAKHRNNGHGKICHAAQPRDSVREQLLGQAPGDKGCDDHPTGINFDGEPVDREEFYCM